MNKILGVLLCLGTLGFSSVAAQAQSSRECDLYARDVARSYTRPAANAAGGALLGAGVGAIIGGIAAGRPGAGAAIGAGIGAGAGLAANSPEYRRVYNDAYDECMSRRVNYREPPRRGRYDFDGGRYEAGSPAWFEWCESRYRSFNPRTGTYRGYDGRDHYCVVP